MDVNADGEEEQQPGQLVVPKSFMSELQSKSLAKSVASKTPERFPRTSAVLSSFNQDQERLHASGKARLGTMIGVYFPSIQHVFGVLIFLRLPWCVGVMGIIQALLMVALCCLTTFTAATSLSAVVANGKTGRGGPYYLITRSLGPEVGSALGVLLCLANTIAVAMYILGGVEIFLISLVPQLIFGTGNYTQIIPRLTFLGEMTNNYRVYGLVLTVIVFVIVLAGVRFTQIFALLALAGMIVSIISLYAGAIQKSVVTDGPYICLLGDVLLSKTSFAPRSVDSTNKADFCRYCLNETLQAVNFCTNRSCPVGFTIQNLSCRLGIPGFGGGLFVQNYYDDYLDERETTAGKKVEKKLEDIEVYQNIATSFFVCLAIYFPSVTGIKTGANMSGDLKKPQKSIPLGTMLAWLTTTLVYVSITIIYGMVVARQLLQDKEGLSIGGSMPISHLAWPHYYVVLIGAFTSTFGAAIQALCSAPKLLQSIADDDVMPFLGVFRRTKRNEPLWAQIALFGVASLFVLVANVDFVAPIVQQMFLSTYLGLNLSCAACSLVGFPSWRPRYRCYNMYFSFFGALLALFLMFATSYYYAPACIALGLIIYLYVAFRGNRKEYGDAMFGLQLTVAKAALLGYKYKEKTRHIHWQPRPLLLSTQFGQLHQLIEVAEQLGKGGRRRITVASTFMRDKLANQLGQIRIIALRDAIRKLMKERRLTGYCKPIVCDAKFNVSHALSVLLSGCQVGHLRPNVVLLNAPTKDDHNQFDLLMETFIDQTNTLIITKGDFPNWNKKTDIQMGNIDIWWFLEDGDLLLALGQIMTKNRLWKASKLRLFMVIQENSENEHFVLNVKRCLSKTAIQIETVPLPSHLLAAFLSDYGSRCRKRWNQLKNKHLTPRHAKGLVQLLADEYYCKMGEQVFEGYESELATAEELNKKILEKSAQSDIVIMNTPPAPNFITQDSMKHYWDYVETMANHLKRVLLVKGNGSEIIQRH